jgi:hypothetical protein
MIENNILEENIKDTSNNLFIDEVAKYFMNFLETDFKKRRIPKRNTTQKSKNGIQVGINLEKYPKLKSTIISNFNDGFCKESFILKKNQFTCSIPNYLFNLISSNINDISNDTYSMLIDNIKVLILKNKQNYTNEYDVFIEETIEKSKLIIANIIVAPLINTIEKPLSNLGISDENSKYQLEVDIVEMLFNIFEDNYNQLLLNCFQSKEINIEEELKAYILLDDIKSNLLIFFKNYTASDAFDDFYLIFRNNNLIDKTEVYLYFYELSIDNDSFPIFYMPISLNEKENFFEVTFDKKLFINTKAIEFIVQQFNIQNENKSTLTGKFDRIMYLSEEENIKNKISWILNTLNNFFKLNKEFLVDNASLQKSENLSISFSNKCYLFLFDKSDEALINLSFG